MNLAGKVRGAACIIGLLAIAAGCAPAGKGVFLAEIRRDPGAGAYIEGVPFFPDSERMCGPAALAGVMGFYAPGTEMDTVARSVYVEKLNGTLPTDLLIYARDKGFNASYYAGGLDDLRENIRNGRPLILFLNLGFDLYPVGHYVVVVGYNDHAREALVNSGTKREEVWTYSELERAWSKTGHSTLLVTPKED